MLKTDSNQVSAFLSAVSDEYGSKVLERVQSLLDELPDDDIFIPDLVLSQALTDMNHTQALLMRELLDSPFGSD